MPNPLFDRKLEFSPEPEFYYCTVEDLREVGVLAPPDDATGFVPDTVSTKRIQKIIKLVSNRINTVTLQHFQPWKKDEFCNGSGVELLHTNEFSKIAEAESVFSISSNDSFPSESQFLVLKERFVASRHHNRHASSRHGLNYSGRGSSLLQSVLANHGHLDFDGGFIFYKGNNNWVIRGVFGDFKILSKIKTELTSSILRGDETIKVLSTDGINDGDSISIFHHHFIVNEVIDDETISIDPSFVKIEVNPEPTEVIRYGRVHDEIRDCAIRLVLDQIDGPLAVTNIDNGLYKNSDDYLCGSMISEKTDNYTYTSSKLTREDRANNSLIANGTGNTYVDSILRRYHAPRYVGFA